MRFSQECFWGFWVYEMWRLSRWVGGSRRQEGTLCLNHYHATTRRQIAKYLKDRLSMQQWKEVERLRRILYVDGGSLAKFWQSSWGCIRSMQCKVESRFRLCVWFQDPAKSRKASIRLACCKTFRMRTDLQPPLRRSKTRTLAAVPYMCSCFICTNV
jgi:hypothetical protein